MIGCPTSNEHTPVSVEHDQPSKYEVVELDDAGRKRLVEEWERDLPVDRVRTLESEIWLERPIFGVARRDSGEFVAFFDLQTARDRSKNLQVLFGPKMAGDEGLTPEDVDRISGLLVFIFVSIVARTEAEGLTGLKIHSHDLVLLTAFSGFARTLADMGYCSVKFYGNWIDVSDLQNLEKSAA